MAFGQADNYIGTYADDAAANTFLAGVPWTAKIGMWYMVAGTLQKRWWDGTAWHVSGTGDSAFPGIELEQVLFVDEGSNAAGSADGSAAAPYQTIAAAYTQAKTLSPTVTNPVTIFIWGGVYDENVTMDTDYINLVGIGRDSTLIRRTGGVNPTVSIDNCICEISNLTIEATVNGNPALASITDTSTFRLSNCLLKANGNVNSAAALYFAEPAFVNIFDCDFVANAWAGWAVYCASTSDVVGEFYNCRHYAIAGADAVFEIDSPGYFNFYNHQTFSTNRQYYGVFDLDAGDSVKFISCQFEVIAQARVIQINEEIDVSVVGCLFRNCYIDITDPDPTLWVTGCRWDSSSTSYDIASNSLLTTPARVSGNVMMRGMQGNVRTENRVKRVGQGQDCSADFYTNFKEALTSLYEDDCVIQLNDDVNMQSLGTATPPAYKFVVDGQGIYGWTKDAGSNAFSFTLASDVTFRSCVGMTGDIYINDSDGAVKVRLVECEMVGTIFVNACAANSLLSIEGSRIVGETQSQYCIDLNDNSIEVRIVRSYLKGDTGDPAIDNPVDSALIKIAHSTVMHGSLSTNSPLAAPGNPAYSSHHNTYNADPVAAGYVNDIGTPYDSFDVNGDWDWGLGL